mmetsp:Transcript_16844/g.27526  ORF Transcript_16844/g.27526 Transcript_16844/m.27526 type:complete len:285 (+) Transcript_16844:222-1076(+)
MTIWRRKLIHCTNLQWSHQLQSLPNNMLLPASLPTRRCQRPTSYYHRDIVTKNHNESPYAVLNVKANASKEEIKKAFRTLAKLHHPDLNRRKLFDDNDEADDDNENRMARLVNAYESLMSKYSASYISDATDSRVALACEIYTIDELRNIPLFDVYAFRINYSHDDNISSGDADEGDSDKIHTSTGSHGQNHLDPHPVLPIDAHPQDSISDLKRYIQSKFATAWGLEDRKRDRDGLYLGWELIYRSNYSTDSNSVHAHSVLSYHLFLESYGVNDGDILHAVVRK